MLCLLVPGSAVLLASRPKYVCDKAAPKKTTEMSRKIHRNPPRPVGQLATRVLPLEESLTRVAQSSVRAAHARRPCGQGDELIRLCRAG